MCQNPVNSVPSGLSGTTDVKTHPLPETTDCPTPRVMENLKGSRNFKMVISRPKIEADVRSQYAKCSKLFMFIPRFQFGHGHFRLVMEK